VVAPVLIATLAWTEGVRRRDWARVVVPFVGTLAVFAWRRHLGIQSGSDQMSAPPGDHLRNLGTILAHYGAQLLSLENGATIESYAPLSTSMAVIIVAAAVLLGLLFSWRGRRVAAFGVALFFLALAPHVLSLPLIGLWANRYAYFPLVGLLVLVGAICADAAAARPRRAVRWSAIAIGGVLILVSSLRTRTEAAIWRDDRTLYAAAVAIHPEDGRALYHLGYAVQRQEGCARSMPIFAEAAHRAPSYARAFRNLAGCLLELGHPADAISPARRAVELEPEDAAHHYNLGAALIGIGRIEEGRVELQRSLRIDPNRALARQLLRATTPTPTPTPTP
jgi:tetratricopeptide (TPR) repeat protein